MRNARHSSALLAMVLCGMAAGVAEPDMPKPKRALPEPRSERRSRERIEAAQRKRERKAAKRLAERESTP